MERFRHPMFTPQHIPIQVPPAGLPDKPSPSYYPIYQTLGGTFVVGDGEVKSLLRISFEEPRPLTIYVQPMPASDGSLPNQGTADAAHHILATAELRWGGQGGNNDILFDVLGLVKIPVVASEIELQATIYPSFYNAPPLISNSDFNKLVAQVTGDSLRRVKLNTFVVQGFNSELPFTRPMRRFRVQTAGAVVTSCPVAVGATSVMLLGAPTHTFVVHNAGVTDLGPFPAQLEVPLGVEAQEIRVTSLGAGSFELVYFLGA